MIWKSIVFLVFLLTSFVHGSDKYVKDNTIKSISIIDLPPDTIRIIFDLLDKDIKTFFKLATTNKKMFAMLQHMFIYMPVIGVYPNRDDQNLILQSYKLKSCSLKFTLQFLKNTMAKFNKRIFTSVGSNMYHEEIKQLEFYDDDFALFLSKPHERIPIQGRKDANTKNTKWNQYQCISWDSEFEFDLQEGILTIKSPEGYKKIDDPSLFKEFLNNVDETGNWEKQRNIILHVHHVSRSDRDEIYCREDSETKPLNKKLCQEIFDDENHIFIYGHSVRKFNLNVTKSKEEVEKPSRYLNLMQFHPELKSRVNKALNASSYTLEFSKNPVCLLDFEKDGFPVKDYYKQEKKIELSFSKRYWEEQKQAQLKNEKVIR